MGGPGPGPAPNPATRPPLGRPGGGAIAGRRGGEADGGELASLFLRTEWYGGGGARGAERAGLVFLRSGRGREWKSEDFEGWFAHIFLGEFRETKNGGSIIWAIFA